ncbi:MAG TPA: hypothetical protein VEA77_06510 [Hyphomicrobium sp.]|nr:hypothetical protein [Hyphomicrobium sp.]
MTFRRFALASTPAARTSAVLSLLALLGVGISAANPEAMVTRRFTAALEAGPVQMAATSTDQALVSGSEAYWLDQKRRHDNGEASVEPAAWSAPLAAGLSVGDRITISSGKTQRVLQVITVADVAPASGAAPRQVAVTCRDVTAPEGRLVTFIAPADTAAGPVKSARAL